VEIFIESRKKKYETICKLHPNSFIIDVTSKSKEPWIKFSPFYPHGNIPVPFSSGITSQTVEGIWQALKVFENYDIDESKLNITSMKGIKRTVRKYGKVVGHRKGIKGSAILSYLDARKQIYLPSYKFVLATFLTKELMIIAEKSNEQSIVLLDFETNTKIQDLSRPLSHASLISAYLNKNWPI
jgi:hypothetical protein